MKDLSHLKQVEDMIAEIKKMELSLPEKMYYIYHLFLEDLTEDMKEDLRTDLHLRSEYAKYSKKEDEQSQKKAKQIAEELLERDKQKAQKLPELVDKIKGEVTEYATTIQQEKDATKEAERRKKDDTAIEALREHIQKEN